MNKLPSYLVPVSIAGKTPDFYKGYEYKKLAPKWNFFKVWKETHDNEYYIKHYQEEVIDKLVFKEVLTDLLILTNSYDLCLLCYEKSGDFCHRHLVADWFTKNGVKCEEYRF
jgi:uncharacterized protein YeaO (DUF488 family)